MARTEAHRSHQPATPVPVLLLVALIPVLPLAFHGPSCGHDFGFHFQSWMDAAQQLRHGTLLPRWAFSPAYNAGEPRFIFYPPLSWLLGSLLLLLLPPAGVPIAFTWLALAGAAIGMYFLALRYTTRNGALLAAAVYVANPYLLFTAYERTAYAELLAAAWMPLLFRAALADRVSALSVAIPLALLWLTNAPAAVMGTYALSLIVTIRICLVLRKRSTPPFTQPLRETLLQATGGLVVGLALPAFYLLPAAWERRYVQIAMAIIPNMRVEDNFLFGHTGYGPHDRVLHTASLVALALCTLTAVALLCAALQSRPASPHSLQQEPTLLTAFLLAGIVFLLLWHPTLPLWHLLPELAFLQFPWRLLAVLGCVLGLAVALALSRLRLNPWLTSVIALALVAAGSALTLPSFRQGCEAEELPSARVARFGTQHGVGPTDEYTPTTADNDELRWDDPAFWLAPTPNAPGPNTVPNPAAAILDYDQPPPLDQTVSGHAPTHLQLHLSQPEDLTLNLRDFPAWQITLNGKPHPAHLQRDDGLVSLALPAGDNTVDIHWHTLPDVFAGDALTLLALATAAWLFRNSRKITYER